MSEKRSVGTDPTVRPVEEGQGPEQAAADRAGEPNRDRQEPHGVGEPPEAPPQEEQVAAEGEHAAPKEKAAAPQGEAEEVRREMERLRADLEAARDRMLRSQAELENYRRRAARQMDDERRYANLPLIRDLLPVWDNIVRAIEAAEKTPDPATLLQGFKMVAEQLESVLARYHCTKIQAEGEPFDPHLHEAILQQPSDGHPANTVLHVVRSGFRLHDRVVRPSQVIVSVPQPAAPPPGDASAAQGKPP